MSDSDRMKLTALVGLALLGSGDSARQQSIEKCTNYIATSVDKRSKPAESTNPESETKDSSQPGAIRVNAPQVDLDPLTAAYLLQFVAESEITPMQPEWMPRIFGLLSVLNSNQTESGAWTTVEPANDEMTNGLDLSGTHITNQVLMALGSMESKGLLGEPDVIGKACKFLMKQHEIRTKQASEIDRRTRTVLNAGTAAALIAINCEPNDPLLRQLSNDALEFAGDMMSSPRYGTSGLVGAAVVARSGDKQDWIRFIRTVRIGLLSSISPDGRVDVSPTEMGTKGNASNDHESDPAWTTASLAISLGMQERHLKRLTGQVTNPMQVARNSAGDKTEGGASSQANAGAPDMPPGGAQMMTLDLGDLSGEGSIEDQIKEKMKEMGLDTENVQFGEIGGAGAPKGSKKKKDDE